MIHDAGQVLLMTEVREEDVAHGGGEASTPCRRLAPEVQVLLLREVDLEPKLLLPRRHGLAFVQSVGFSAAARICACRLRGSSGGRLGSVIG